MIYRCVTVTAQPGEEIMEKIYQILNREDGYYNTNFQIHFLGFEMKDTDNLGENFYFLLNKMKNKIPSTGYFITPYNGEYYMNIKSIIFPNTVLTNQNFWIIY